MSTATYRQFFLARGNGAFLNYLHGDLAVTGVVLLVLLAFSLSKNLASAPTLAGLVPGLTASAHTADTGSDTPAANPLTPSMAAALDHVVQRYRVSADALQPVFEAVQSIARQRNLDPLLIVAVISVESRFNPFSQSSMGAQGLMQIIPRYHQDKIGKNAGQRPFLDPISNVRIGAQILQEAIRRQGGLVEGLQFYGGASDDPEQSYANRVIAEKARLEQAARRKPYASVRGEET